MNISAIKKGHIRFTPAIMACALLSGAMLIHTGSAEAKRASKEPIAVIQPDGKTLKIFKHGDEYGHYLTTEDNIPVINKDGVWYYAALDDQNAPISSGMEAMNPGFRSAEQKSFLAAHPAQSIRSTLAAYQTDKRTRPVGLIPGDKATRGPGLCTTTFPSKGEQKGLVILVEFSDKKFTTPNPKEYWTRLLNDDQFSEYGATGSARQYFIQNSNGQFLPEFDVYGPVTLPQRMSHYGGNDRWGQDLRPEQMVIDACKLLNEEIDFAQYDRDNNGIVDNVYVFYAGYGEADYDDENTIWPHSWDISESSSLSPLLDGKMLDHYACSNELDGRAKRPDGIGTFVHEFSHVLGLPDLYCTENVHTEPFTPGEFSVLDYGPYNNNGITPPNYSAYERYALGWITPSTFKTQTYTLDPITENIAYIVPTDKEREFFLIENRQLEGFDAYIPMCGMLVWHVDVLQNVFDNNSVNNTANHQYVDLLEADNIQSEYNREGDTFPGFDNITELKFQSGATNKVNFKSWSGANPGIGFYNIHEEDGKVIFDAIRDGETIGSVADLVSTDGTPYIENLVLRLNNTESATVYTLTGQFIGTTTTDLALPAQGIYIVKTADDVLKLFAR